MALRQKPFKKSFSTYREKELTQVHAALARALKRFGLDQEIGRYQFVLHWEKIVGPEIAKLTRPDSLKNGILVLRVPNSVWAQELSFSKDVIVERLREYLRGSEIVEDVRFRVGDFNSASRVET